MSISTAFPLEARAELCDVGFSQLRAVMLQQAQAHELKILEDSDSAVSIEVTAFGQYRLAARGSGTVVTITAALPDRLFMLKDGFCDTLAQLLPKAAESLRWTQSASPSQTEVAAPRQPGQPPQPQLPPNLHFTTVQSITSIGTAFLRVQVKADDLSSFQDDAIHFRLVLPPEGCSAPEWPSVSASGATLWPKGDKALHRPVYTTRWIDRAAGLMAFDIFLHAGGRATNWVRAAAVGDQLAIAGPGGGGLVQSNKIVLFADETAFPAAARILENLSADSQGQITLVAEQGAACGYPITAPKGVEVIWLTRSEAGDIAERALTARAALPDHFFWFAGEKSTVTPVRTAIKASDPAPGTTYIAAYWSQP